MKNKFFIIGIIAFILFLVACSGSTKYSNASYLKYIRIPEINNINPKSGTEFNTGGFVVKIFKCPPCPKTALCEPCMPDNIVISEDKKKLETYDLNERDLIVFVKEPNQFKIGTEYGFSLRVMERKINMQNINDIELLGYET